ncbi:MAG: DUF6263 family protein [Dysgonamonadaceae bacterium]|jgi:hypothetical protein|nr:DUF6263 family protein [Dysgonamonadaceae bacterium]
MENTKIKLIALVIGALFTATSSFPQEYNLAYNLKTGDSFNFVTPSEMVMKMDMMGQDMEISVKMEFSFAMKTLGFADGAYSLEMVYTRMKMQSDSQFMGSLSYSTDGSEDNGQLAEVGKAMKAIMNVPFTVKVDKYGKLLEVQDLDKLQSALAKAIDEDGNPMLHQMIEQQFSEKQNIENLQTLLLEYPARPLKIGDAWEIEKEGSANGLNMKIKSVQTLTAVENGIAVISVASLIDSQESAIKTPQGDVNATLSGNIEGTIRASLENGMVQTSQSLMNMDVKTNFGGMDMNQKLTVKSEVRRQ